VKKALLLSLAATMMLPLATAGSAEARPGPYPGYYAPPHHYRPHVYVPVYRPRPAPVIVVRRPPPPPVVVVHHPPPRRATVVRRAEPAQVAHARPAEPDYRMFGLGLRLTGATLEGEKLGLSSAENPTMGGVGLHAKGRLSRSFGLELSLDHLSGDGDNFTQRTVPVMASFTYHLFPESRFQVYGLAGAGVHFTRLEYLGGRYNYDMTELAGQLGVGVEFFLSRNISISADLRAKTIFKNLETQAKIRQDCLHQIGGMVGFCDNIHSADPNDKFNLGFQFQAGATWYF